MAKGFFGKIASLLLGEKEEEALQQEEQLKVESSEQPSEDVKPKKSPARRAITRTKKSDEEPKVEKSTAKRSTTSRKKSAEEPARQEDKPEKSVTQEKQASLGKNIIQKEATLTKLILDYVHENSDGNSNFEKKELKVFVAGDMLFFDTLIEQNFEKRFAEKLDEQLGLRFSRIVLASGKPGRGQEAMELAEGILIQIKSNTPQKSSAIRRAAIYPVEGCGSLKEECYLIDSEEIKLLTGSRYNIGIGSLVAMSNGMRRTNHIAIDDDQASADFVKNRFVSRAHAHIAYSEREGFLLYVEPSGTRMAQKRTHIIRGAEQLELNNPIVGIPLRDGDYIVLSKHVHLLFKQED